ncbi:UDP-N-acetylmuramate-alanine ligase [Segniliparus rugosus ATCC BAA-974]|uniref:UDP-N-acetylmuramate--L-alanine ligase n=1 Tax=Segniliparus rugosus (strain ATCC BAA-974 / DSM 45345 / CCUG 50838 / CIP 108380 / JCM 13579 / CDC 945) TaxID=679197 RepID=U1N9D1_SEGRC|nr:UDP-N-acetylmuramate--L-alanine ligase [Segniliparus rugosus]ERG69403.1 UDP-N-acetylmuramate-alanine ligase [Segniliparus rugosus ATCC BAA-974]
MARELDRVHFVGIGGAGMSAVARILLARGAAVSGSDLKDSRTITDLRARGAKVLVGHDAAALDLLDGGPTAVVVSQAAIPADNPELAEARRRGVPIRYRPEVLAALMEGSTRILISGTHGKTTTTSMTVTALQHAGLDPSFAVGGELGEAGTNAHHGSGGAFVAEADESDGSLLRYQPDAAVVTNVEADHLDHFGSEGAYVAVFDQFVRQISPEGLLIVDVDDPGAAALGSRAAADGSRVFGYGSGEAPEGVQLAAKLLDWSPRGAGAQLTVAFAPGGLREFPIAVPGRHMARNALGAVLAAVFAGASLDAAVAGVSSFTGVRRRFQLKGTARGVRVFDDYAHHPTEVAATLAGARALVTAQDGSVRGRLVVVFQPHMYSRTRLFASEFASALEAADEVVVLDVYGARETPEAGVTGALIADQVRSVPARFVPMFSSAAQAVASLARQGDVVITMGAGDVTLLGGEILDAIEGFEA